MTGRSDNPRILVVNPCYHPARRYGGPIASLHALCRAMVARGADVTVFTTTADGPDDLPVPTGRDVDVDGVRVVYFPVTRPRSFFRSPELGAALRTRIEEFALVHVNWLYCYPTLVAARECARQGIPYLLAPRGMLDPHAIALKGTLKKKLYLSLIEAPHLHRAAAVHFTSVAEREQAAKAGWRVRSIVVPNGVALAAPAAPAAPAASTIEGRLLRRFPQLVGKRIVLVLGRVNYIKGLDLLARAWPDVAARVTDAHLLVVGPDDHGYGATMRALIPSAVLERSVTFTGLLTGSDKDEALALSEMLVCSSYLESFGMAVVEAMACARPVVVTDRVSICGEIAEAGAGIVVSCSATELARGITTLLEDGALARRMGANGEALVRRRFAIDVVAGQMIEAYQAVLDHSP